MQTIYFETKRFIRHEGNVVDLAAYRQKLAAVSGESWPPQEGELPALEERAEPRLSVLPKRKPSRRAGRRSRRERLLPVLDLCASAAVLLLTAAAVAGFLSL